MSERIVMRTGECLIAGGLPFTAAEPEVVIGELNGPVGTAIATLTGNQSAGHSNVFVILDAVRAGDIPKEKANELGIICSVWLNPGAAKDPDLDHEALFDIHPRAMARAIHEAVSNEPTIDWLLENKDKVPPRYYQRALDAKKAKT
jgi:5,6,7,8-tetrahydromethanopterin hydro-lyase